MASWLRWWNTRYKNPHLVVQHCFVASFGQCFSFFTLHDQLNPQHKHLLQVEEMQCADWFIAWTLAHLFHDKLWVWWKTSNKAKFCGSKKISAPLFTTTFFYPKQMFLLRDKLIMRGEKRETLTKTCNKTMLHNKLKVFVSRILPPFVRSSLDQVVQHTVLFTSPPMSING